MKSPDVTIEVCEALLRELLEGYRGFPPTSAGVRRFAFAIQENCISVGHARATLQSFEDFFPTVRQIHDVAFGIRPQFEPEVDQRAEWEKKYGKPQAFQQYPADFMAMHWQAFRDILYYTEGPAKDMKSPGFWDDAKFRALQNHPDSMAFVRHQISTHGWPAVMQMAAAPEPMPYRSPNPFRQSKVGVPVAARITQADIDRAQAARKSTAEVDRDLDSWDDPDR
jgi:hypothetical protein